MMPKKQITPSKTSLGSIKDSDTLSLLEEESPISLGTSQADQITAQKTKRQAGPKTRVTIKYDVGFNNNLYIRGNGANLNWNHGTQLKNVKHDEWVWETDASFSTLEFKVLINDKKYENGPNHILKSGTTIQYTPSF